MPGQRLGNYIGLHHILDLELVFVNLESFRLVGLTKFVWTELPQRPNLLLHKFLGLGQLLKHLQLSLKYRSVVDLPKQFSLFPKLFVFETGLATYSGAQLAVN